MKVIEIVNKVNDFAPFDIAMEGDNVGLLLGHRDAEVHRALVTLDADMPALKKAVENGCELIFSHHPFIFSGEAHISDQSGQGAKILYAAEHKLNIISAHTNLDSCRGGINDTLGELLNLTATDCFVPTQNGGMLGRIGTHRFESVEAFLHFAKQVLHTTPRYRLVNDSFERVAWVSGSGSSEMVAAAKAGADTLITGDCKYSAFMNAAEIGINLIDLGHFETEQIILPVMERILTECGINVLRQDIDSPIKTLE